MRQFWRGAAFAASYSGRLGPPVESSVQAVLGKLSGGARGAPEQQLTAGGRLDGWQSRPLGSDSHDIAPLGHIDPFEFVTDDSLF